METPGNIRKLRITLSGKGYTYSLFVVKDEDASLFSGTDKGVFLRNKYCEYNDADRASMTLGQPTS